MIKIENCANQSATFSARFMPFVLGKRDREALGPSCRMPLNATGPFTNRQRATLWMHPPWLTHAACRDFRVETHSMLKMQRAHIGLGTVGAAEKQIDSLWPLCYSSQFARCAGASCETIQIPAASEWKSVGVRRFRRRTPKWNATPRKGADSIMGIRVAA